MKNFFKELTDHSKEILQITLKKKIPKNYVKS